MQKTRKTTKTQRHRVSFHCFVSFAITARQVEQAFCAGPKDRFILGTAKHAISCGGLRPPQEIACLTVPKINLSFGPVQKACSTLTTGNSKGDESHMKNERKFGK